MVLIRPPGDALIILRNRILDVETRYGTFQVVEVGFVGELGIVITDDHESLVFIPVVPFPEGWHYVLAIDTAEGPHFYEDDLAAQVGEAQRRIYIQPDIVGELRSGSQVGERDRVGPD
jgi:hypothetical protein